MKICNKCNTSKPLDDFYKMLSPDGHHYSCKDCVRENRRSRYANCPTDEKKEIIVKQRTFSHAWREMNKVSKPKELQSRNIRIAERLATQSKTCRKCQVEKCFEDFHKHVMNRDGHAYDCKMCANQARKAYYSKIRKQAKND